MEKKDYLTEFRKIFECSICLSVVHNPKQLVCDHSFCKSCLDKILVFKPNGSASIKCPNGCETETIISSTQTTNDLHNNYMLKSAVDLAVENDVVKDEVKGKCSSFHCSRNAIKYCWRCQRFRCADCYDAHKDADKFPDSFTSVDFCSRADRNGVVYCTEHLTEAEYLCCERNYLCIYCKHRSVHKNHQHQLLTDVEKSLRDLVQINIDVNLDFTSRKHSAETQMKVVEEDLNRELKRRKIKSLVDFNSFLEREEKAIKACFRRTKISYNSAFESVDYFKKCLLKETFEILLAKRTIEKKIHSVYFMKNDCIPGVAVSLSEGTFIDAHPLGCLKTTYCHNDLCKKFKGKFNDHHTELSLPSVQLLIDRLTELVKEKNNLDVDEIIEQENDLVIPEDLGIPGEEKEEKDEGTGQVQASGVDDDQPDDVSSSIKGSDENNNQIMETQEVVEPHQCDNESTSTISVKNVKRTVECSFQVNNMNTIYEEGIFSDSVVMGDYLLKINMASCYQTVNDENSKYAGIFLYINYKGANTVWSINCDVDFSIMSHKVDQIRTRALSYNFKEGYSNRGYSTFIKWDDLFNPNKGYIFDNSLNIKTIITANFPVE